MLILLIAGVLVIFGERQSLFPDATKAVRYVTAGLLALLGWLLARTIAQGVAPQLFRRLEPGTAGTTGFLIRLLTIAIVVIVSLRIAGVKPQTLAVGGAFTAVVLGLAAQQTLAHVFAGLVLLTTRPFKVGDRVRLRGGLMAGEVEGIVGSLGLFYTTLISSGDRTMVPNNVLMQLAVIPINEPDRVELRAKFNASVTPQRLQRMLEKSVTVPLRNPPHVSLEEVDGDEITWESQRPRSTPPTGRSSPAMCSPRSATATSMAVPTPTTRTPTRTPHRSPDGLRGRSLVRV